MTRPEEKHISDHFSGVSETEGGRAQQRIFLTDIYLNKKLTPVYSLLCLKRRLLPVIFKSQSLISFSSLLSFAMFH